MEQIWIIALDTDQGNALARRARSLAHSVQAISLGAGTLQDADLTLTVTVDEQVPHEAYAAGVATTLRDRGASYVLFDGDAQSRLLAGLVAATLGVSAAVATSVDAQDPALVERLAFGGLAVATERITGDVSVVVAAPGAVTESSASGRGEQEGLDLEARSGLKVLESQPRETVNVNLGTATRVVGVGRGFAEEKDLDMASGLAAALGAELACTRPIAEGVGWMPTERYLGVSGATIKPELYVALGLSGQVQHMVGVNQAKVIVAINKDKNAPIFEHADFGIVGDLYQVLPALTEQL